MSAVVVIDDALRSRVAEEISGMARSHPTKSLAGDVVPQHFDEVVDGVCGLIDLTIEDFEAATIIALAFWKNRNPSHFIRRRAHPNPPFSWKHA
jgi:hypothetical protein